MSFSLGRVLATPGALAALYECSTSPEALLTRHAYGDWGDADAEDWAANDQALLVGARLLSSYSLLSGTKIWVITEADHSATTILLPSEY